MNQGIVKDQVSSLRQRREHRSFLLQALVFRMVAAQQTRAARANWNSSLRCCYDRRLEPGRIRKGKEVIRREINASLP